MWLFVLLLVKIVTISCETLQHPLCADGQLFFTTEAAIIEHTDDEALTQQESDNETLHKCRLCVCSDQIRCIPMHEYSCKYYEKVSNMISGSRRVETMSNENYELKNDVETRLFDSLSKASRNPLYPSCVPLASEYSDCTKDNICLGCKRCSCDPKGEWLCSAVQLCEDGAPARGQEDVAMVTGRHENYGIGSRPQNFTDHILKDLLRKKRSSDFKQPLFQPNVVQRTISYTAFTEPEEASTSDRTPATDKSRPESDANTTTKPNNQAKPERNNGKYYDKLKLNVDVEDMVFDDFVNPESQHSHNEVGSNVGSKPQYSSFNDYVAVDGDENITATLTNDLSSKIVEILDIVTNLKPQTYEVINASAHRLGMENGQFKIKDQLKQPFNDYFDDDEEYGDTKQTDIKHKIIKLTPPPSDNEIDMYPDVTSPANTKKTKREILQEIHGDNDKIYNKSNVEVGKLTTDLENMQTKLLEPLIKIINDKRSELFELRKMKNHLIKFIKTYNKDFKLNETTDLSNTIDVNDSSIYKIESLDEGSEVNLNEEVMNKHLNRLKQDIYNVVYDIIKIQKQARFDKTPIQFNYDLRKLIRAMKHYVKNHVKVKITTKVSNNTISKNTRRNYLYTPVKINQSVEFGDNINDILTEVAKPIKGSINKELAYMLSKDALEVLTRIKEQLYHNEKKLEEVPVFRTFNNITEALKGIGNNWNKITKYDTTKPSEKMTYLKYLYLHICEDIKKINKILAVFVFADSRKMMSPDQDDRIEVINNLNADLIQYSIKVTDIIKDIESNDNHPSVILENEPKEVKNKTKIESDLVLSIKRFIKKSKDNIMSVLQEKIPKSVITKRILKKRLESVAQNRVNEYENKLKEWQDKLNVISKVRTKRSMNAVDLAFARRMQHVIPNYLRGKIFPALKGVDNGKGHNSIKNKVHTGNQFNVIPLKKH